MLRHLQTLDALFRSIIGSVLYAANMTRMDIAFTVSQLSRHLQAPLWRHLVAAKQLLRYLAGTRDYALTFTLPVTGTLEAQRPVVVYSDASWANDLTDRKSTSGLIVKLFGNAVMWASRKQKAISKSTTEAEYYAVSDSLTQFFGWSEHWQKSLAQSSKQHCSWLTTSQQFIFASKQSLRHCQSTLTLSITSFVSMCKLVTVNCNTLKQVKTS